MELESIVGRFTELSAMVVGDAMLDVYWEGDVTRLCREAPVPLVRLGQRTDVPGAAANTALNLASLGATVCFIGVVGDDDEGTRLHRALDDAGVDCARLIRDRSRQTLTTNRVVGSSQLIVRFDSGTTDAIDAATESELVEGLAHYWTDADVVIVSDYAAGTFTARVVDTLATLQKSQPLTMVVDAKKVTAFRDVNPTAVKPNWSEAQQLIDAPASPKGDGRADAVRAHGHEILDITGARIAAVTLDTEGAIVVERDAAPFRTYRRAPTSATPLFATGAGDSFVSALALALAADARTPEAAELASAAAGVVVGKPRTAACTAEELRRAIVGQHKLLADGDELAQIVAEHRQHGRSIIFTNGCFDILHRGHTSYLSHAKLLGDVLIVGVNDDDSVRALKGDERPINPLDDRLRVLTALSCVDYVVPFGGLSPTGLLTAARPDVFAKGGNYTRATLPEVDLVESLGGRVVILPNEPGSSTTNIIERVRTESALKMVG
jgi:D-beta-D-heptose 7-phosphate kinase / D-beta-D-heptose 1-phosphate adenosyltransferase